MNTMTKERSRWSSQVEQILDRLKEGPATNGELSGIALKYTSRISEARQMGHKIDCQHLRGGLTMYSLR